MATQQARSSATREAILAAAEREFGAHGYAGARVTAIARRAGVTHAMLNYHFGGKARLYDTVVERSFTRFATVVGARTQGARELRLRDAVGDAFDVVWEHPEFVQLMLWEMVAKRRRTTRAAARFADLVASIVGGRSFGGLDGRDVYVTLLGALVAYFFRDPVIERLLGAQRFREADRKRRRAHLVAIVDRLR
jgi:AcrR family transcriptional regulator